ncbi:MAG: hypothetical protein ACR2GH_19680, partial [Pseudonocardia sp.]
MAPLLDLTPNVDIQDANAAEVPKVLRYKIRQGDMTRENELSPLCAPDRLNGIRAYAVLELADGNTYSPPMPLPLVIRLGCSLIFVAGMTRAARAAGGRLPDRVSIGVLA